MALMQYEHDMVVTCFEASLRHIDTELGRVFTNEPKDVEYDTAVEACRHIDTFLESLDFEEEEEEGYRCIYALELPDYYYEHFDDEELSHERFLAATI